MLGSFFFSTGNALTTSASGDNRFDGNIKGIRWNTDLGDGSTGQNAYLYTYDNNLWLNQAQFGSANSAGAVSLNPNGDYRVFGLSYDPNGNLLSLSRNRDTRPSAGNAMDSFTYNYASGTNQLNYVSDAITADTEADDLQSQSTGNYTYNNIGQLIHNAQDGITYTYNTSGLVTNISKDMGDGTTQELDLNYNDRGHRVHKQSAADGNTANSYYVRDASGQPMAIYTLSSTGSNAIEYPVYGSSRLGINYDGETNYEVTDHLGNVRAVIKNTHTFDEPSTIIFQDDFNDNDLSPWEYDPASAQIQGDQLRLRLNTDNTADVIRISLSLEAGHRYEYSSYVKFLTAEDQMKVGIRKVSDGSDDQYRILDSNIGNALTGSFTPNQTGDYYLYFKSYASSIVGTVSGESYQVYLDDMVITDMGEMLPIPGNEQLLAYKDYYPFGMPMPNRNVEGDYRYAFQGQEKDPETGKEAFELRLWDSRIGRWLTTDPYNEYFSPYLGMGNNPISNIDRDGGCVKCDPNAVVGSTATDAGGYGVTMTETGWVRDDGYVSDLGSISGSSKIRTQVSPNTFLVQNSLLDTGRFEIAYPEGGFGLPDQLASDGLNYYRCASCHAPNGAYRYAAYNSAERQTGLAGAMALNVLITPLFSPAGSGISTTANARNLGIAGEQAVGVAGSKVRIPSLSGTAKFRIPDGLTSTTLIEVKNVNSLSLTRQVSDFHLFTQQSGGQMQFILYTRSTTTFTGPLKTLIDQGHIIVRTIPGL